MPAVTVIVPSRNEVFLQQTVSDLLAHGGDIEVIVVLEGYWPDPPLQTGDRRLVVLHRGVARGLRAAINDSAAIAKGKYLLKVDAHCAFDEGYDEKLLADMQDNWVVVPRRYSLDPDNWKPQKEPIDYEHIFYPYLHPDDLGVHGRPWLQRGRERQDILIDEDMSFQGSCWFMSQEHFHKRLGGLSEYGYGSFKGEPQEIHLKTQLGKWGGALMRNKKTWFAHLHKGKRFGRMYSQSQRELQEGNAYSFDLWWNNRWTERAHDIEWLIDKFWPVPNWPDDWRERKHANS